MAVKRGTSKTIRKARRKTSRRIQRRSRNRNRRSIGGSSVSKCTDKQNFLKANDKTNTYSKALEIIPKYVIKELSNHYIEKR